MMWSKPVLEDLSLIVDAMVWLVVLSLIFIWLIVLVVAVRTRSITVGALFIRALSGIYLPALDYLAGCILLSYGVLYQDWRLIVVAVALGMTCSRTFRGEGAGLATGPESPPIPSNAPSSEDDASPALQIS